MKAIQIRYLPVTNHMGARLKVWAEGVKPLVVGRNYELDAYEQGKLLAEQYLKQLGWHCKITGYGALPCGDYCATLG